jgi:hypothetical protein
MSKLNEMSLSQYLVELSRVALGNEAFPLDASSNPIELNWDWYNWYGYIGEDRYTEAHLALCNLGFTFENYKG